MLRTLNTKSVRPKKSIVGVGGDSKAGCNWSKIVDKVDNEVDDEFNKEVDDEVEKKGWNPSKSKNQSNSKNLSKSKKTELGFLISGARMAFIK